jgi:hypothetical protein
MEFRGPVVTEDDVATFEQRIGHRLPEDYRRFLLEVNGGRLDTHTVFVDGIVNMLYSLNDPDEDHNLLEQAVFDRSRSLRPSPDLLSIGYDDGAAPIMIGLAGEHRGEVWFENTSDPRPVGSNPRVEWFKRRDMKKLADSFEQFMGLLKPYQSLYSK